MKYLPTKPAPISQGFGQNANISYSKQGLKGHTGIDFGAPYGNNIRSVTDSFVYSILNKDNKDLSKYRAVCTLFYRDDGYVEELIYGHCNEIYVKVSDKVSTGTILATVGNTGEVYANGNLVTIEEKQKGSKAGAHLHFQKRLCKIVQVTDSKKRYLINESGIYKDEKGYYEVIDFNNGFNGCSDSSKDFDGKFASDFIVEDIHPITDKEKQIPILPTMYDGRLNNYEIQMQINVIQKIINWIFSKLKSRKN